jgi:RimJ/RimL family protein N-acetyltransferase
VTTLRTERLELRPMDADDLGALVELDGFEEVRSAIDPFSEHIPLDPGERREYERRFLHPNGYLAAIDLATGRFLGWFQLQDDRDRAGGAAASARAADAGAATARDADAGAPTAGAGDAGAATARARAVGGGERLVAGVVSTEVEIGYRLRPDAWGQGFATEGGAALLAEALSRPDVSRVYAHALLSNSASIRVMQKIGMTYAGPWSYRGLEGAEYEAVPGVWRAVPGTGPRSAPAKRP